MIFNKYLENILNARPKLTGSEIRIILFVYLKSKSNVTEIARGTGISKSHTSEMCLKLLKKGILKRKFNEIGNLKYPMYSIDLTYGIDKRENDEFEMIDE